MNIIWCKSEDRCGAFCGFNHRKCETSSTSTYVPELNIRGRTRGLLLNGSYTVPTRKKAIFLEYFDQIDNLSASVADMRRLFTDYAITLHVRLMLLLA